METEEDGAEVRKTMRMWLRKIATKNAFKSVFRFWIDLLALTQMAKTWNYLFGINSIVPFIFAYMLFYRDVRSRYCATLFYGFIIVTYNDELVLNRGFVDSNSGFVYLFIEFCIYTIKDVLNWYERLLINHAEREVQEAFRRLDAILSAPVIGDIALSLLGCFFGVCIKRRLAKTRIYVSVMEEPAMFDECLICLDAKAVVLSHPCLHPVMCAECFDAHANNVQSVLDNGGHCFKCRRETEGFELRQRRKLTDGRELK